MRHHHHQVRVASEGRRVVAPRLTARLQRSPIGPTTNMIMNTLLVAKSPWKITVFTARCYASAVLAMALCLSVSLSLCLSQVGVQLKRLKARSDKQHHTIAQRF